MRRRDTMRISLACAVLLLGMVACVSDPEPDPVQDSTHASSEASVASVSDSVASEIAPAIACKKPDHVCKGGGVTACCLPSMNCHTCLGLAAVNAADPDTESQTDDSTTTTTVPEELQLPESAASCRRAGGVCTNIHICFGSGRHTIPISCPGQNACCV
jgi:hypothetical protein